MEYTNTRGVKWYLHKKEVVLERNKFKRVNYYFKKTKGEPCDLPSIYRVVETKPGMPVVKRI